ncbi:MAG: hypothetical protein AAFY21_04320 [Cyanobacteria bacterium J06641_2]
MNRERFALQIQQNVYLYFQPVKLIYRSILLRVDKVVDWLFD